MKFELTDTYRYWWPVEVKFPDPQATGKWRTQTFQMQFEAMPQDEANEVAAEIAALAPAEKAAREHDLIIRVCKDWVDVIECKEQVPFSEEALRRMLRYSWMRIAIYTAYGRSLIGDGARLGN